MADWLADQVFYEVFPDRFAAGGDVDVRARRGLFPPDAELRGWDELPATPPRGRDFFGGDLDGVRERLGHVTELGATALYLTPVFTAASNHRYDATDFDAVDPALGGDAALRALLGAASQQGVRVVLDAVLNHVSDRHPWARDPARVLHRDGRRQQWRGFGHMPELDLAHPGVRASLVDGPDALLRRWVRAGAAGWRLDVACDLEEPFVADARCAVLAERPDACTVAEVMSFPGGWMGPDGPADAVMNYYVRRAVLDWMAGLVGPECVTRAVRDVVDACGLDAALRSWSMLASHDTPRSVDALGDRARAAVAGVLQFTLPGAPVVYYGEEVGMRGGDDPLNRAPMRWKRAQWHRPTWALYRALVGLRRGHRALRRGAFVDLAGRASPGLVAFLRVTDRPEETVLVLAGAPGAAREVVAFLPHGPVRDGVRFADLLPDGRAPAYVEAGRVRLELPARGYRVLGLDAGYIRDYRFYGKR